MYRHQVPSPPHSHCLLHAMNSKANPIAFCGIDAPRLLHDFHFVSYVAKVPYNGRRSGILHPMGSHPSGQSKHDGRCHIRLGFTKGA